MFIGKFREHRGWWRGNTGSYIRGNLKNALEGNQEYISVCNILIYLNIYPIIHKSP